MKLKPDDIHIAENESGMDGYDVGSCCDSRKHATKIKKYLLSCQHQAKLMPRVAEQYGDLCKKTDKMIKMIVDKAMGDVTKTSERKKPRKVYDKKKGLFWGYKS